MSVNTVAIANADPFVRNAQRIDGICEDIGQWIVNGIFILVRPLKEVQTNSRWVRAISLRRGRRLVIRITVVCIAQATLNITPDVIVCRSTDVSIDPYPEVRFRKSLRALVDQYIVVEGHVVDLVIGREREGLCPHFHTNWLAL